MKWLGMEFAPLNVPFKRRLQTLAALCWILTLVVGGAGGWAIWVALLYFFPILRLPLLAYAGWIYWDRHDAVKGERR